MTLPQASAYWAPFPCQCGIKTLTCLGRRHVRRDMSFQFLGILVGSTLVFDLNLPPPLHIPCLGWGGGWWSGLLPIQSPREQLTHRPPSRGGQEKRSQGGHFMENIPRTQTHSKWLLAAGSNEYKGDLLCSQGLCSSPIFLSPSPRKKSLGLKERGQYCQP